MYSDRLLKSCWEVRDVVFKEGRQFIIDNHYAKGGSNTFVYIHGLYHKTSNILTGVAWWLPPTRVAAESVNSDWKRVLSLTRLAISPNIPKNACSFLLGKSINIIKKDKRFVSLVTYADESQGHQGTIYKATNWEYVGRKGPYPRWLSEDGVQVSCKSTKNRTKKEMEDLGHVKQGSFFKHKYVIHLL